MSRIPLLREDDPATPADARAFLEAAQKSRGRLVNIYRALANRPAAGMAFAQLAATVYRGDTTLDLAHGELAYLTATAVNNCYY